MSEVGSPQNPNPAPEVTPQAPAAGSAQTAAAPNPVPAAEPAPVAPASNPNQALLDRIDRLTREKYDLQREIEISRRGPTGVAAPSVPPPATAPVAPAAPAPTFDAAEVERRAEQLANERLAAQSFQRTVASIADAGLKAFPAEWAQGVANLQRINALDPESINAIHELGDAHLIVHALSQDLNEAARIAGLPPAARGVAYARLADKVKSAAAARVSQAPAPAGSEVTGGAPSGSGPQDRDSMDQWAAARKRTSPRWGGGGRAA